MSTIRRMAGLNIHRLLTWMLYFAVLVSSLFTQPVVSFMEPTLEPISRRPSEAPTISSSPTQIMSTQKPTLLPRKPSTIPTIRPTAISARPTVSERPTPSASGLNFTALLNNQTIPTAEYNALHDLFISAGGDGWAWLTPYFQYGSVWNFTGGYHNPCAERWQGLYCQCDLRNCTISEINLGRYHMVGTLPESIGAFTNLTNLALWYNELLTGTIPTSIGNLSNVNYINMERNSLYGTIPSTLFNLSSSLHILYLSQNSLTGTFPNEIASLINLVEFDFSDNLLHGTLPDDLWSLTKLAVLFIDNNRFSGTISTKIAQLNSTMLELHLSYNKFNSTIPSEMGELVHLSVLTLASNNFIGTLPQSLANLLRLTVFDVSYNKLTGSILSELGTNCIKMTDFSVANNQITGTIPSSFSNMFRLVTFAVNSNMLEGTIPTSFYNITLLKIFIVDRNSLTGTIPRMMNYSRNISGDNLYNWYIADNTFTGEIPYFVCSVPLVQFLANNNLFTGTIPQCFDGQSEMAYLFLNNNYLHGRIPNFDVSVSSISGLNINNNLLSGSLPEHIGDLHTLQTLYAQYNSLTGSLQPLTSNNTKLALTFVDMSNNQFTGTLPLELFNPSSIVRSFSAATNCITGSIPAQICELQALVLLDLDGLSTAQPCRKSIFPRTKIATFTLTNQITGGIPPCLFAMETLETLHLSGNQIDWKLPQTVDISTSLQQMTLSHNKIRGSIPNSIFNKQWTMLDLSYNRITGVLPENQNLSFAASANYTLTLQNNRLSGDVPSVLFDVHHIDILNGNLFNCDLLLRNDLPRHDKEYITYQCGSNPFDRSIIIWSAVFGAVAFCFAILLWMLPRVDKTSFVYLNYMVLCQYYQTVTSDKMYLLTPFAKSLSIFRYTVLFVTVVLCIIVAPVYVLLTVYFNTLTYEYAWTVSAAFLSGSLPAVLLLILYSFVIFGLFVWRDIFNEAPLQLNILPNTQNNATKMRHVQLFAIICINGVVMIAVNILYVLVILNYNTRKVFFTQVGIAALKLLWNDFALRAMVRLSREKELTADTQARHIATELPTMTFIVLFNTIIAPCLATMVVDPSCFFNAFFQPASITSSFSNEECNAISFQNCTTSGGDKILTTTYEPPFIYSYQCSGAILTNYASVYVYMAVLAAFVKPVLLVYMNYTYKKVPKDSILYIAIDKTLYGLLKPPDVKLLQSEGNLFQKERFILRIIAKLAIFLTFGVVFPPLAAVMCVSFYSETITNEILLGKFLCDIKDEALRLKFADKLCRDCEGTLYLLREPMMKLVVPFAALFYACFIFDIYGYETNWNNAIVAALFMALVPAFIYVTYFVYSKLCGLRREVSLQSRHKSVNMGVLLKEFKLKREGEEVKSLDKVERKGDELQSVQNIIHTK